MKRFARGSLDETGPTPRLASLVRGIRFSGNHARRSPRQAERERRGAPAGSRCR
jgi:hypothetical protein